MSGIDVSESNVHEIGVSCPKSGPGSLLDSNEWHCLTAQRMRNFCLNKIPTQKKYFSSFRPLLKNFEPIPEPPVLPAEKEIERRRLLKEAERKSLQESVGSDNDQNKFEAFENDTNPDTGEINGPRGPEPTRFGDWERKGRVTDF